MLRGIYVRCCDIQDGQETAALCTTFRDLRRAHFTVWQVANTVNVRLCYSIIPLPLFHDLLLRSYLYHCVWSGITGHSTRPRPLVAVAAVQYPGSVYRCHASRGQSTVKCSALL